jgi:hypothetical protein
MRFSLGSRTGRTLLHQCSYPESRVAVPRRRHTPDRGDPAESPYVTGSLYRLVPGVVSEASGDCGPEESGGAGSSPEDELPGGDDEGGTRPGAGEDGADEVGGHVLGLADPEGGPVGVPVDVETQGDGELGEVGALGVVGGVGVVKVTDGEGRTGGWVVWSLWPVSPRCRAIQSWRSGS